MISSLKADLRKMRSRSSVWVLGALWLILALFFGYVLPFLLRQSPSSDPEQLLAGMLPESVLRTVTGATAGFGETIALILAAVVAGSEYGWGTVKTVLTQRPSRLEVFAGQVAALALVSGLLVLLASGPSAVASYTVAQAEGARVAWPEWSEVVRGLGAAWLILGTGAALGFALAVLFRQTAAAIGLGLVYLLLLEALLDTFARSSELVTKIAEFLPTANANALVRSFGGGGASAGPTVDPGQAALVLFAYTVGLILLAGFLYVRRDVL